MANKPTARTVRRLAISRLNNARALETNIDYLEERRAFIDTFTLCDVTCKAYIEEYKKVKHGSDDNNIKLVLDMRVIPSAFERFDVNIARHFLTPVFGAGKTRNHKSCKKLRDGIVHAMNEGDLLEMHQRYTELMGYMNQFLSFFNVN